MRAPSAERDWGLEDDSTDLPYSVPGHLRDGGTSVDARGVEDHRT